MTKWITFFSQTGGEIANISQSIGRWPDLVVTNKQDTSDINVYLREHCWDKIYKLPLWPKEIDYMKMADMLGYSILNEKWKEDVLVTLHGYLRILPADFCDKTKIFNGHPGLITRYPELKGFNPQKKAWELKHKDIGCVIHQVIPELDSGPIVAKSAIINEFNNFDDMVRGLHNESTNLWIEFLNEKLR